MIHNKLILIRHGESEWNKLNQFTGWKDIDLSIQGKIEAKAAGQLLKSQGFSFDYAYTSVLRRAIHTLWYILKDLNLSWIPIEKSWCLNERHYGSLQGLNKLATEKKYGAEQVQKWRRSFEAIPPKLKLSDARFPGHDPKYSNLNVNQLPAAESLELTFNRVVPFWENNILPYLKNKKKNYHCGTWKFTTCFDKTFR